MANKTEPTRKLTLEDFADDPSLLDGLSGSLLTEYYNLALEADPPAHPVVVQRLQVLYNAEHREDE